MALSSPITFEAGQFVVLRTREIAGGRAYSMANYVRGTNSLDLVVKRKLADGFYLDELATHVAAANSNLKVTFALSHEPAPATAHPDFPAIKLAEGMVHEVTSRAMAGCYDDVIGFIAGPPPRSTPQCAC